MSRGWGGATADWSRSATDRVSVCLRWTGPALLRLCCVCEIGMECAIVAVLSPIALYIYIYISAVQRCVVAYCNSVMGWAERKFGLFSGVK
jgi:hypothetical protein